MCNRGFFTLCCTEIRLKGPTEPILSEFIKKLPASSIAVATSLDTHHLVCYVGDSLSAYAALKTCGDGVFELQNIVVDPQLHRNGIGSCLLAYCEKFARARKGDLLKIHSSKEAAGFFSKLGFGSLMAGEFTKKLH